MNTPNPNPSPELLKTVNDAAVAYAAFVEARNRMNAAVPAIDGTKAERDLYDERYKADHTAEREHFRTAISLAHVASDVVAALSPQALPAPGEVGHPDDRAVDLFAARMKTKLAMAREKGRGGWDDPAQCSVAYLQQLLGEHVAKGDPVDVANFCMMLSHYGATTTLATVAAANDEGVRVTASEQVAQWQQEHLAYPGSHWGDAIAWNSAFTIAAKLDESAAIRLLSQGGGK